MKLLLYCTKGKPYLYKRDICYVDKNIQKTKYVTHSYNDYDFLNGKIIGECDYEVEEIKKINTVGDWFCYENQEEIMEKSKIDVNKFFDYLQGKNGYAIHIKNLHIFDEPKKLSEYYHLESKYILSAVKQAPQNMMYVYENPLCSSDKDRSVLISIQPQWLCKILNGEKTIEVRKKVLKEMIEK